jgi:hypothetical protein
MATKQATTQAIRFKAKLVRIGSWTILKLPADASQQLPSRGQVMAEGTFNAIDFQTPLEPDGLHGHWFKVDDDLLKASKSAVGDTVSLAITPTRNWPEPDVPADLEKALKGSSKAHDLWQRITPMARWEWIRWTRSTGRAETRQRRIEVGISKLEHGERRPCCWNRNLCTEPQVSKNGFLLKPSS